MSSTLVFTLQNKGGIVTKVGSTETSVDSAEIALFSLLNDEYKDVKTVLPSASSTTGTGITGINATYSIGSADEIGAITGFADNQHYLIKTGNLSWNLNVKSFESTFFTTTIKTTAVATYTFHVLDLSHLSEPSELGVAIRKIFAKQKEEKESKEQALEKANFAEKSAAHLQAFLDFYAQEKKQIVWNDEAYWQCNAIGKEMTTSDVNLLRAKAMEINSTTNSRRPDILNLIGLLHFSSKKDTKSAIHYYRMAAGAGFLVSMLNLIYLHESDTGIEWKSELVGWKNKLVDAGYTDQLKKHNLFDKV